jgi:hypothetical protein
MPIRPENRWLYPIDWQQLSDTIRFDRAGARCERCARPHLRFVAHLGDGDGGMPIPAIGVRTVVDGSRFANGWTCSASVRPMSCSPARISIIILATTCRVISPHCASAAICSTMRLNTAGSDRGTSFACAHCVTCTKILTSRGSASRIVFRRPGQGGSRKSSRLPDTSPPVTGRRGNLHCTVGQVRPTPELKRRIGPATDTGSVVTNPPMRA